MPHRSPRACVGHGFYGAADQATNERAVTRTGPPMGGTPEPGLGGSRGMDDFNDDVPF